jgi:hypothetical protein
MTEATAAPSGKAGPADLIEIFYAPRAVFERRQDGKFGMPYVALVVLGAILYIATKNLIQPVIDAEISRAMAAAAARKTMTQAQIDAGKSMGNTIAAIGPLLFFVIAPFVVALFVWIMGKIAKVGAIGTVAMVIAVFSLYPRLIGSVVGAGLAAVLPEGSLNSVAAISLSPARFVDPVTSPGLAAMLGRFDLFLLWGIVLIAIGVQAAARGTKGQAWTTAIGVWVIGSLPAVIKLLTN